MKRDFEDLPTALCRDVSVEDLAILAGLVSDMDGKNIADNTGLAQQAHEVIAKILGDCAHLVYGKEDEAESRVAWANLFLSNQPKERRHECVIKRLVNEIKSLFKKVRTA